MTLMKEVTAVGSHIPGSSASKLRVRNKIRGYMGYFGLPHLYVTMNPNAKHSPIFHAMWGDEAVDLAVRFPDLADSVERGRPVASDPITGTEFFDFSINCFFRDLWGWDKSKAKSSDSGGIFGKIRAYYEMAEFTDQGQLHGHFLIWLDGGLNPTEVHEKMKTDKQWKAPPMTLLGHSSVFLRLLCWRHTHIRSHYMAPPTSPTQKDRKWQNMQVVFDHPCIS